MPRQCIQVPEYVSSRHKRLQLIEDTPAGRSRQEDIEQHQVRFFFLDSSNRLSAHHVCRDYMASRFKEGTHKVLKIRIVIDDKNPGHSFTNRRATHGPLQISD